MIKKGVFLILLTALCVYIISYSIFYFQPKPAINLNLSQLKNGDLILRCGRSAESFAVYSSDVNSEFTHIGIIVIENNNPVVVHAVPNKLKLIKKESLKEYLAPENASKYAVYRGDFSTISLNEVSLEALNYFNSKIEFDTEYDLNSDSKLYCTELILKAFEKANIKLNLKPSEINYIVGKHKIIFPSAFTHPPFKKVKLN